MATTLISSKKSSYGSPYAYYTFTAEETSRTSTAVTIKFTAKGKLQYSSSFLGTGSGYGLVAGVYIGGAWKTWTLKSESSSWSGTSWHSASKSFSIKADRTATSLTGIKVRVLRSVSSKNAASLKSTTASTSSISIASSATYNITYNGNGANEAFGVATKQYNKDYQILKATPTRSSEVDEDGVIINYFFGGWKGNDGKIYQPGALYKTNKDLTLTAIWNTEDICTITYDCGDYSPTVLPLSQVTKGGSLAISGAVPSVPFGFTFLNKWADQDGAVYNSGQTYTINKNLFLSAQYSIGSHVLAFNLNGGTSSVSFGTQTITPLVSGKIPEDEPEKTDMRFIQWNTKQDGSGQGYKPGQSFTFMQNGGTVTLYAIYADNDIRLYSNGKISCVTFIEGQENVQFDGAGSFFANNFIEGQNLTMSASYIQGIEFIET